MDRVLHHFATTYDIPDWCQTASHREPKAPWARGGRRGCHPAPDDMLCPTPGTLPWGVRNGCPMGGLLDSRWGGMVLTVP